MLWFVLLGVALLSVAAVPYLICLLLMQIIDTKGSPVNKTPYEPTVSVVLPTYNEEEIIEGRLENLVGLDYPVEKMEIIVVDSGDDDTAMLAREFLSDAGLDHTVIEENERRGVAAAVNLAVAEADGEIVFRTDCDSRVDADALREAVANFADPTIGAVTGRQSEVLGDSQVERDYRNLQTRLQLLESHLDSTFVVHGPCFLFRRSLFRELPHNSLADDTEIGVDVRQHGYRVILDPSVRFTESGVSEFRKRRQRKDRRAKGLLDLLVRRRDMIGTEGWYGWFVLPANFYMMWLSPWFAITGVIGIWLGSLLLPPVALLLPVLVLVGFYQGQADRLGRFQPIYAFADSLISCLIASVTLQRDQDGKWKLDQESREWFKPD